MFWTFFVIRILIILVYLYQDIWPLRMQLERQVIICDCDVALFLPFSQRVGYVAI